MEEKKGQGTKITKETLGTLKALDRWGTRYADRSLRGFYVRVKPDGSRHFEIRYGPRLRRRRFTIGKLGRLTLDQARARAKQLLAQAALGEDPRRDREIAQAMPTFGTWKEVYVKRIRGRLKSAKWIERYLNMAEARWKLRPLDSIRRADVEALYQKIGSEHRTSANRWHQSIRPLFAEAVREGILTANPAEGIKRYRENSPRARVLSDDEMKHLLDAVAHEKDPHARVGLYLLVESGARVSEVLRARWEDFDLEAGTWRIPSPKAGYPQVVPLSRSAVAKLRRTPRLGAFVVAGHGGRKAKDGKPAEEKPRADFKGPWARTIARAKEEGAKAEMPADFLEDLHVHDVRRTFGLHVAKAAGLHVASKLLRHGDVRITERVYAPLGIEDLRAAVEKRSEVLPFAGKTR